MNMRGLVIGKFYPPHAGHHFVIDTALSECDRVQVVVFGNSQESIPAKTRVEWLRDRHPKAEIFFKTVDLDVDYNDPELEKAWAEATYWALYPKYPADTLYSSEEYGEGFAAALQGVYEAHGYDHPEVVHRMVDLNRVAIPVSATKIRHNPIQYWDYLSPAVRAGLTKRVVICGAESTGTTTLAKDLAARYQTVWVPEFGRTYSEALGNHYKWSSEDFKEIMEGQVSLEEYFACKAGPVMFCDTDSIATLMFHSLYLQQKAPESQETYARLMARKHSLYIITNHSDVPFDDDGYRLFPDQRKWATEWFEDTLMSKYDNTLMVSGGPRDRIAQASAAVDKILHWDFTPPIDEAVA